MLLPCKGNIAVDLARVADPDPNWIRIQPGQWIRIGIRIRNPDSDPRGKNDHKNRKKLRNFIFWGQGKGKLYLVFYQKKFFFFQLYIFFIFGHQNPWIRIASGSGPVFSRKGWIRIRIRIKSFQMNKGFQILSAEVICRIPDAVAMLEEDLTDTLLTRLTSPHVLQRWVQPLVRFYELLQVSHQLIVLGFLQAETEIMII
jgi:hypothetical protein